MIELTVKTLDSRNHTFSVPDDFTVKQLKEHIAESVNLSADSQRLIYCGRVLQDDKNLCEYDLNGKVIHLVQRAPPVSNSGGTESNPTTRTTSNTTRRNQTWRTIFQPGANPGNAMYLGAMAFPADLMDAQGISMPQPRQCLSQSRLAVAQGMLRKASNTLNRLENPTATTSSSSPQESSSDISPDPNANTNVSEEPLASSIALAAQAATAAALAAAVSAAQTSISNLQEPQSEGSGGIEPETISDGGTTGPESDTSRATGQQSAASSEEQRPQTGNSNNNTTAGSRSQTPHTTALADLLDQLTEVNTRLQPFLAQYHQLMRDDPVLQTYNQESQQQLFGSVSEIMHFLSHAYHALSDIMCDFSLPPPRYLRCRPVLIQHSAVLQTGIPIQAQINLTSSTSTSVTTSGSANSTPVTEAPTASQPAASQATANETTTNSNTQPTPRAQAQQQTSGAQGGRSLNLPSGFELFMDVSPGSITIDSLEATVVTNASAATTDASPINIPWNTTSSTQQPPPEFIQNLMQVLASQIMDGGNRATPATTASNTTTQSSTSPAQSAVPGQNSQARGNTATHPTTATQTRSTARPHVHLTPAMQSLGASNFDPFLPCNSHHIRSSRRRTSQHRHSVSISSQTTTQQQTSPSVQAVQINVVQSGRSNTSQEPERPNNRRTVTRSISPFQGLSSFFPIDAADIVAVGSIDGPLQEDTVNEVPEGGNLTLSIFTQLIQRITGGAAPPTSTLAEFLETLPDYSYTEGESIFMDLFMTLAQSFTFMDMMNLGMGRSDCLIRARPQLRRLISQRLLRNEPANENSINAVVARFNLELRPYFNILNSTRLREEVDLIASVNLYNTSILPQILEVIMLEEDETEYHCMLLSNCKLYIYDICAILQYCCLDGNSGMENIIRNFVCQMTNGVPAALQEWTVTSSVANFRNFIGSLDVPLEHIRPFLVYRIGQGGQLAADSQVQEPMEMETEAVIENGITPTDGVIAIDAPITVTQSPERMSDVVWQNTLPADWVPIITRDSQRQRRQNSQPPFSDAYLSGMPSKRRKLITTTKPPANLSHVISDSMASALGSAGMGSGPEVEVVAQRASQDPTIRSAYREQVRSTLRHNLQTNSDFKPEKYPNAAKFFDTAK